jgi:DNA sulfur modification protein DndB
VACLCATLLRFVSEHTNIVAMKSVAHPSPPQARRRRRAEPGRLDKYAFPAIRGVQAGREYFVSMCPLRVIPRLFLFDEPELMPEMRAQRSLNRSRVPEIARYVVENPRDYVFSAITASIDADVRFEGLGSSADGRRVGLLHIPVTARIVINDGQHRRAAIELALQERPELAHESIAVVFFMDIGLERSQQMFADLNQHAIRPSRSLSVLYDHRDDRARLAKLVVFRSPAFHGLVELERSSLSPRSARLFTLSAIASATAALVAHATPGPLEELAELAADFWARAAECIPEWRQVHEGSMCSGDVRRDYIHSTAVVLEAIAVAGSALLQACPGNWRDRLAGLATIDWTRSNTALWEGRAMTAGVMSKSRPHVILISNVIKMHLELDLTEEEMRVERAFAQGERL